MSSFMLSISESSSFSRHDVSRSAPISSSSSPLRLDVLSRSLRSVSTILPSVATSTSSSFFSRWMRCVCVSCISSRWCACSRCERSSRWLRCARGGGEAGARGAKGGGSMRYVRRSRASSVCARARSHLRLLDAALERAQLLLGALGARLHRLELRGRLALRANRGVALRVGHPQLGAHRFVLLAHLLELRGRERVARLQLDAELLDRHERRDLRDVALLRLLERLDPVLRVVELLVLLHQLELRVAPQRVQVLHLRGELLAALPRGAQHLGHRPNGGGPVAR